MSSDNTDGDIDLEGLAKLRQQHAQEEAMISWARLQLRRCKNQRIPVEQIWYVNLAMYFRKQYVQILNSAASANGFQLITPKAPPWRVRLAINRIRPLVRKQVSNLTQQAPKYFAVPASTEDEDIQAANIAEAILDAHYREDHYKQELQLCVWWGSICGSGFLKTYWDSKVKDSAGNTGKFVTENISPFYIYVPNLLTKNIEHEPYVIHAATMSVEEVKQRFGVTCQPNVNASLSILEDQFLSLVGVTRDRPHNECLVCEYWIKPGKFSLFPNGGFLRTAGDQFISFDEGWPYDHGQYPFSKFDDVESGRFYGEAFINDVVPIQREYNRTRSQIIEAKNLMAKPKLVAQRGSINPHQITSEPGQVILYTPGMQPPAPLQLPSIPTYVETEVERLVRDMEDISGQHDLANQLGSRTAATALSQVQESDSLVWSSGVASVEQVTERVGNQVISLARQFWTTSRTVKVVGYDQAFETQNWKNTDISANTEIYVEQGSATPYNRAGRQAFLMDLYKLGAIPADYMLDLLDMGGFEKIRQDILIDQRQAQRENLQMVALGTGVNNSDINAVDPYQELIQQQAAAQLQSQQAQSSIPGLDQYLSGALQQPQQPQEPEVPQFPVNSWDNHIIHIQMHNRYRKTQRFEGMPDIVKKIFEAHVAKHQAASQQQPQSSLLGGISGMPGQQQQMPQIPGQQQPQQLQLPVGGGIQNG